ncbi:oocyte zinc finger protein XlCOF15-like [Ornithodoros turicata]|uniref:oocyte zinc finger protein XlCOF15-like n=1 Tax=Ornithodoros turicata TaxID=34597 RepID=UPI0031390009
MAAAGNSGSIHGEGPSAANCPTTPFQCTSCDELFSSDSDRSCHIEDEEHHIAAKQLCFVCGFSTMSKRRMAIHRREHMAGRTFVCNVCTRDFPEKSDLTRHISLVHRRMRLHACDACGKAFHGAKALKEHRGAHTGNRPFLCTVCGKAFQRGRTLRRHKCIHKPHKSPVMVRKQNGKTEEKASS